MAHQRLSWRARKGSLAETTIYHKPCNCKMNSTTPGIYVPCEIHVAKWEEQHKCEFTGTPRKTTVNEN